jgi:hypothetical protein
MYKKIAIGFLFSLICIISIGQKTDQSKFWGSYFFSEKENETWAHYQLCEEGFTFHESSDPPGYTGTNGIIDIDETEIKGNYRVDSSSITLYSISGEVKLMLQIIDSLNYTVLVSDYIDVKIGDIFHRESSYFESHECYSLDDMTHARWIIVNCSNQEGIVSWCCHYMEKPGGLYVTDYDTIIEMPISIYK